MMMTFDFTVFDETCTHCCLLLPYVPVRYRRVFSFFGFFLSRTYTGTTPHRCMRQDFLRSAVKSKELYMAAIMLSPRPGTHGKMHRRKWAADRALAKPDT